MTLTFLTVRIMHIALAFNRSIVRKCHAITEWIRLLQLVISVHSH